MTNDVEVEAVGAGGEDVGAELRDDTVVAQRATADVSGCRHFTAALSHYDAQMHTCAGIIRWGGARSGAVTAPRRTGHVVKSRAMSRCRPIRARVLAALVAILLSATLALASGGQPPVQATVRAVADVQVMSTPGSEAFRSGLQQSGTNDR